MNAFQWVLTELMPMFAKAWNFCSQELFTIGDLQVSILGMFSVGALTALIVLKLVRG